MRWTACNPMRPLIFWSNKITIRRMKDLTPPNILNQVAAKALNRRDITTTTATNANHGREDRMAPYIPFNRTIRHQSLASRLISPSIPTIRRRKDLTLVTILNLVPARALNRRDTATTKATSANHGWDNQKGPCIPLNLTIRLQSFASRVEG